MSATTTASPGSRDKQLADSFPASDPPSTTPLHAPAPAREPPDVLIYRVVAAEDSERAFSNGHAGSEGRWSSAGRRVVYASSSPAAALLEFLVHLQGPAPAELRMAVASVPADCVHPVGDRLPDDWNQRPYRAHVQRVGDCWMDSGASLALYVPSALSPRERNVLLNLGHDDMAKLKWLSCDTVVVDERLRQ